MSVAARLRDAGKNIHQESVTFTADPNSVVDKVSLSFHTHDDNKDHDTAVNIVVWNRNEALRTVAAATGTEWTFEGCLAATPARSVLLLQPPASPRATAPEILPVVTSAGVVSTPAGQLLSLAGSGFGAEQGRGFVSVSDGKLAWGSPAGAPVSVERWTDGAIEVLLPVVPGPVPEPAAAASVVVVDDQAIRSTPVAVFAASGPVISAINPGHAAPGDLVVISGTGFGTQAAQPDARLMLVDDGKVWESGGASSGLPVPGGPLDITAWTDTQIAFIVPEEGHGQAVDPASTAQVQVFSGSPRMASNAALLRMTTSVAWPISLQSPITNIGRTQDGHMQTSVTIDAQGNMSAVTTTWDTNGWGVFTGFHGAAAVVLLDERQQILAAFGSPPFGVMGGQHRTDHWQASVNAFDIERLGAISVVNFYDPQYTAPGHIWDWVRTNWSIIKDAIEMVTKTK